MKRFDISGMSCAACSSRVEKTVSSVEGVDSCSVNLLTSSLEVQGDASSEKIIASVEKEGYGACEKNHIVTKKEKIDGNSHNELIKLIKRFAVSLFFLLILMYVSMGHNMFHFPLPLVLQNNYLALSLLQLLLSATIMVINQKFFINGFRSLIKLSPNMDSLVAIGSSASFIYSVVLVFNMTALFPPQNQTKLNEIYHNLYFESAAMILVLITVGKILEAYSKGKTTNSLNSLMDLAPKKVLIVKNGKEILEDFSKVSIGDVFIVKPGDVVPLDGIVIEGKSSVNEASITGESIPIEKNIDDIVVSGSQNLYGSMQCKAQSVGEETMLSKIIKIVSDASSSKAPIAKIADKVSGVFVPIVILISIITVITWLLLGESVSFALNMGISVLVISCPCSLGLATPVAIMVGNGVAAKNGVLFKNATVMEQCGKVNSIVIDKTGTITKGEPKVTDVIPFCINESELLEKAFSIEKRSEHPLAKAITDYVENSSSQVNLQKVEDFKVVSGFGVSGFICGKEIISGNKNFIKDKKIKIDDLINQKINELSEQGKTPLIFAEDDKLLGIIAVADVVKEDSAYAISLLKKLGVCVKMLTGDNQKTAEFIAKKVGIDDVVSGVHPLLKVKTIEDIKKSQKKIVAMVGDGINDAPALVSADIGIAVGNGSDIAIDSANIVILNNSLVGVVNSIKMSRKILINIKKNLFFAFFYNALGIPLAAGLFINLFGWKLNPMIAAAAMSLSSFCVVSNALMLNFMKVDKKNIFGEDIIMEKTFKTKGMMCEHCENHVKSAIMTINGVKSVSANHTNGIVKVNMEKNVDNDEIINAIKGEGYEVIL